MVVMYLTSCKNKQKTEKQQDSFPVTAATKINTHISSDYVAEIHALQNVEIRARVSGYLEEIHVDEGVRVKKNQLLFSINKKEYIEELAKAKALYKSSVAETKAAEIELKNAEKLASKQIISKSEVELAANKLDARKAQMEEALAHQAQASLRLSNTDIRAPFDGIINRIPHKVGSLIDEGILLTTLSNNDAIFAYFDVSESEYLDYARNMKQYGPDSISLTLILADGSEHLSKGRIESVDGLIDHGTGNIAFRARFDNPENILKHGASGRVRINKPQKGALVIPQKSSFEIQDKLYVYIVDKNNKVEMREITTSKRLPHLFIVSSGLKEGEKFIYEGIQNIRPGLVIQTHARHMKDIIRDLNSN
jgi:membrane fusion protein (multidrug efflux system)